MKTKLKFFLVFTVLVFVFSTTHAQSLKLTGSGNLVNIGNLNIVGNKVTVEALINLDNVAVLRNNIVSKHQDESNVNYLLRPLTFEITTYISGSSGPTKFLQMANPYTLTPGKWYHVAGTYDGSRVKYYVDGCKVIDTAWSGNLVQNNISTSIGNITNPAFNEQFVGLLDEVRIWSIARSDEQIQNNMTNLPSPLTQTGLEAYYKFSSNLLNSQGNAARNGTVRGSIAYSPQEVLLEPFAITEVQRIQPTCSNASNGSIRVTSSRTAVVYSINGTTYQTSPLFTNLNPGVYTVYVRAAEGCILDTTVTLVSINTGVLLPITQTICEGNSLFGYTTSGVYIDTLRSPTACDTVRTLRLTVNKRSFSRFEGSVCRPDAFLGYTEPGTYLDTFTNSAGCDSIRTTVLRVSDAKIPNLGKDSSVCNGQTLLLNPGTFDTYLWQDGTTSPTYLAQRAGLYTVVVQDGCGTKSDSILLNFKDCKILFPNSFTPNRDGRNEIFRILNGANLTAYSLQIFNRWGEKVWSTTNPVAGWDGNFNGAPQSSGVFVYLCQYGEGTQTVRTKGVVALLR